MTFQAVKTILRVVVDNVMESCFRTIHLMCSSMPDTFKVRYMRVGQAIKKFLE